MIWDVEQDIYVESELPLPEVGCDISGIDGGDATGDDASIIDGGSAAGLD